MISWKKYVAVPQADGTKNKDRYLLKKTFYKVGHHGSHNATMRKSGLDIMESPELVAMIPTNTKFALSKKTKKTPDGWKMPEQELLEALEKRAKGRVILADEAGQPDPKSTLRDRCKAKQLDSRDLDKFLGNVEFEIPPSLIRDPDTPGVVAEPLYVDYIIE